MAVPVRLEVISDGLKVTRALLRAVPGPECLRPDALPQVGTDIVLGSILQQTVLMTVTERTQRRGAPDADELLLSCYPQFIWPDDARDVAGHLETIAAGMTCFVVDHPLGAWRNASDTLTFVPAAPQATVFDSMLPGAELQALMFNLGKPGLAFDPDDGGFDIDIDSLLGGGSESPEPKKQKTTATATAAAPATASGSGSGEGEGEGES